MKLSKSARRGIMIFSSIQKHPLKVNYMVPRLTIHEQALREDKRFERMKPKKKG